MPPKELKVGFGAACVVVYMGAPAGGAATGGAWYAAGALGMRGLNTFRAVSAMACRCG